MSHNAAFTRQLAAGDRKTLEYALAYKPTADIGVDD